MYRQKWAGYSAQQARLDYPSRGDCAIGVHIPLPATYRTALLTSEQVPGENQAPWKDLKVRLTQDGKSHESRSGHQRGTISARAEGRGEAAAAKGFPNWWNIPSPWDRPTQPAVEERPHLMANSRCEPSELSRTSLKQCRTLLDLSVRRQNQALCKCEARIVFETTEPLCWIGTEERIMRKNWLWVFLISIDSPLSRRRHRPSLKRDQVLVGCNTHLLVQTTAKGSVFSIVESLKGDVRQEIHRNFLT